MPTVGKSFTRWMADGFTKMALHHVVPECLSPIFGSASTCKVWSVMSSLHQPLKCLRCEASLVRSKEITGEDVMPGIGDITICIRCAFIGMIDKDEGGDFFLRRLTTEEYEELLTHSPFILVLLKVLDRLGK